MNNKELLSEILPDLVYIYNERIEKYRSMLLENKMAELDMKSIIERIIEESILYRDQIIKRIGEPVNEKGKIYNMWQGIEPDDVFKEKKEFLDSLANEQLSLNNIYLSALSFDFAGNEDLRNILLVHQRGIDELYIHIRRFHDAQ